MSAGLKGPPSPSPPSPPRSNALRRPRLDSRTTLRTGQGWDGTRVSEMRKGGPGGTGWDGDRTGRQRPMDDLGQSED